VPVHYGVAGGVVAGDAPDARVGVPADRQSAARSIRVAADHARGQRGRSWVRVTGMVAACGDRRRRGGEGGGGRGARGGRRRRRGGGRRGARGGRRGRRGGGRRGARGGRSGRRGGGRSRQLSDVQRIREC